VPVPYSAVDYFQWLSDPKAWVGLLTLTILEIVLGVDNIVFISILAGKLPEEKRNKARQLGLAVALVSRILLLLSISWLASLTKPLFTIFEQGFSGRDLILAGGGLFLLYKAVTEIHEKLEGEDYASEGETAPPKPGATLSAVIVQIMLLDIVFSLDSVITAVGMIPPEQVAVMIIAVIIAVLVMLVFVNPLAMFVEKHPTVKMLALSFLVLIGVNLVAEGLGFHIPKGYTYFAMGFSVLVEMLNLRLRKRGHPVHLHSRKP
jgi:predicted tellurium resistance membrane protein TerC